MVKKQPRFNKTAGRAFTRPAILRTEHLNISIRTVSGERDSSDHKFSKRAIDKSIYLRLSNAIEMLGVNKNMAVDEIIQQVVRHIHSNAPRATNWFVGVRSRPRLHPYDEAELLMPTSCWIDLRADSPEEVRVAVRRLPELAVARRHEGNSSPNEQHVFAYALNRNQRN